MKNFLPLILISTLLFNSCDQPEKETYDVLISNVNIVDVESGEVISGKSILISGDTIRRIENDADMENFSATETLDAGGKFIMPGLWDMHVHFRGGDTLVEENKDLLPLFLAYGVTTVRDAGGDITPEVLEWREQIKNGELAGPDIYTPGPKLDGTRPAWPGSIKVTDEEEIEKALDSLEAMNVDYVKMYDGNLTKEAFYNIIKAAEKRGLKTTGHMPLTADFLKAVELGLDGAEHMYYPLKSTSPVADSLTELGLGYGMIETIIDTYDPELAKEVFEKMSAENVYVTPTLHIGTTLSEILDTDHTQDSLLNYVGSGIQETYRGRIEGAKRAKKSGSAMRQKMEDISEQMIKPMHEAGVNLLAGSDSGAFNSFVYPGESLIGELKSFVEAGLTPQEALITSVINGPKFFEVQGYYGGVTAGKVAHLILLEKNPLENLDHLDHVQVVIKDGRIYNRSDLQDLMRAEK